MSAFNVRGTMVGEGGVKYVKTWTEIYKLREYKMTKSKWFVPELYWNYKFIVQVFKIVHIKLLVYNECVLIVQLTVTL